MNEEIQLRNRRRVEEREENFASIGGDDNTSYYIDDNFP